MYNQSFPLYTHCVERPYHTAFLLNLMNNKHRDHIREQYDQNRPRYHAHRFLQDNITRCITCNPGIILIFIEVFQI